MSLASGQQVSIARLRELVAEQRAYLAEMKELHRARPMPPPVTEARALTNATCVIAFMEAELNGLAAGASAAVMTGQARQVSTNDLELHPANLPELMLPLCEVAPRASDGKWLASNPEREDEP